MGHLSKLVSVVIPVYNAAPYLEACLNSIIDQSYEALEIIVINDGSTDNSNEIIHNFSLKDKRIKPFTQENHGLGYTRNRGISLSNGEFVFFLDSDDLLPASAIKSLVIPTVKENADYAVGKVLRVTEDRRYVPIRHKENNLYEKTETTSLLKKPELLQDSIACNKLWRKDFLTKHGLLFTEGKYYEDLALTLRGAVLAERIAVIHKSVYYWRVREEENSPSITQQQMKLENTKDRLNALLWNREWLLENNIDKLILSEHDLKSLLDVLRLHAIKYALTDKSEKTEWEQLMLFFLKQIPEEVALKLPGKEKTLYYLLTKGHFSDLELFSQMYTNTETSPIVKQDGQDFFLNGTQQTYEVTSLLKPKLKIKSIEADTSKWTLHGELTIPKASKPINGSFYATNRNDHSIISLSHLVSYQKSEQEQAVYPFERQTVEILISPKLFSKPNEEDIYDFYFKLDGESKKHPSARVRLNPEAYAPSKIAYSKALLSMYRTNNGNLSLKSQRSNVRKFVKEKIKKFFKL